MAIDHIRIDRSRNKYRVPKNRAHVRYWLWLSASLKFLLPFAFLIGLGRHFDWNSEHSVTHTPPVVAFSMVQISEPF